MKLPTDNQDRANICWCCIYLANWRTSTMKRNQIGTYFDYLEEEEKKRKEAEEEAGDKAGE